jgi:molybdate transport system permease protein
MGEFGVVLMVGGNIEGVTKTASIAIYEDVQMLNYAAAGQTALLLITFSFTVLVVVYSLHREAWSPWLAPRDE